MFWSAPICCRNQAFGLKDNMTAHTSTTETDSALTFEGLLIGHHSCQPLTPMLHGCLQKGCLTCVLGNNGVGKTTLLYTLAGQLKPLNGRISYQFSNTSAKLSQHQLSPNLLAQTLALVPTRGERVMYMRVCDLLYMARMPYRSGLLPPNFTDKKAVCKALEWLEIPHLRNRYLTDLSDGELQKVMLARALAQDTPIILLDEPTSYLDFQSAFHFMTLLKTLAQQEKKAILCATHDLAASLPLADTLWLLTPQAGITLGSPMQLHRDGILVKHFGTGVLSFFNA